MLIRGAHRGARILSALAVLALVLAWGVAQWDYILPETLTVAQAAAPSGTITAVLVATVLAVVLLGPSFALLLVLDQRSMLAGEGVEDAVASDP